MSTFVANPSNLDYQRVGLDTDPSEQLVNLFAQVVETQPVPNVARPEPDPAPRPSLHRITFGMRKSYEPHFTGQHQLVKHRYAVIEGQQMAPVDQQLVTLQPRTCWDVETIGHA